MLPSIQIKSHQIPLIHVLHKDDLILLESPDAEWFRVLHYFPWEGYRGFGAEYYDALYEFNLEEARKGVERSERKEACGGESKEEARQRLLFGRASMQKVQGVGPSIIHKGVVIEFKPSRVTPESICPGVVPQRLAGKKPKCFFALFKSFLGATLMGFPPEPESVYLLLRSNPSFIRVCGFAPKAEKDEYCFEHAPSLRKLEQFDQIMKESGLWGKIKLAEVSRNLESGAIKKEKELVGDTTHYHAYSGFETVSYVDDNGKERKKSQAKPTKKCRCEDTRRCGHPWELADDGAGTIVKSDKRMYWGHKASILGLPRQGIPLDAAAISDAATFDGETLFPHVVKLLKEHPGLEIERVLYDSACDSDVLREKFQKELGIELKASFNPRRAGAVAKDLPRGMEKITPYGVPICKAGYEMDYKGIRYESEKFIYQAPIMEDKSSVCLDCKHRADCCPNSLTGRTINVSFDLLPQINPDDPPMAKRFKAIMARRPSVERMIKRLKCDLSDDRLTKRGNDSFQAYLDKTMIAFHVLLRH